MQEALHIHPDWNASGTPLVPTWSRMVNVDQFVWMTRADMLEQLAMAKADLGFGHVRACGMLDDKMKAWTQDPRDFRIPEKERPRHLNFQLIDMVLDRLLGMGIKPLYTTTFTPAAMASGSLEIWQHSNTTPPKDLKQWSRFLQEGIKHEMRLRGDEEVASWYFECWNEPNLQGCFFSGSQAEWFDLWAATHEGIKAANPGLRIGGPSTARGEWIEEFLAWTKARGCEPDYLISHFYNNDSDSAPLSPFDGPASHKVKDSPHFGAGVARGTRKLLDRVGYQGELHWNEWGRSWFPADPFKETALEAAYIVKTMAEVSQTADIFAFWCLSDIYDQAGYSREEFQGNYGMLSLHGLRKPAYFAHMLLNRAVGQRLPIPAQSVDALEGAMASRTPTGHALLVYRYPESIDATTAIGPVCVPLPAGATSARLYRIDSIRNNIIATWRDLGSPAYLSLGLQSELAAANDLISEAVPIHGGAAQFELETPGAALLEISAA